MISRRRLLELSALGAGAAVTSSLALGESDANNAVKLPPSIAALQSMKSQAVPITVAERTARLEKARRLMTENGVDAIFISSGTSLRYFLNIRWWQSERMFAFVLPAKGDAFFVCPAFEEERAREQISLGPIGGRADVRTWQEDESPYERVAQGLKDRAIATGTLGVDEAVPFVFSHTLAQVSQVKMVSATPITAGCRMIKSQHELDLMRLGLDFSGDLANNFLHVRLELE